MSKSRFLLALLVPVAAFIAALLAAAAKGAAATPIAMNYACAANSTGAMRYVSNGSLCKKTETAVAFHPGPVYVCADGSVRRVSSTSVCKRSETPLTLPQGDNVYFCASNTSGGLRYVSTPGLCTSKEFPVYVAPPDTAPYVTDTNPANGSTGWNPVQNQIQVNFNEPVNFDTSSFGITCNGNTQSFDIVSGSPGTYALLDANPDLPKTSNCTATVIAANITDADSNDPPDHPDANYSFSFQTLDDAPYVVSTSPSQATDVPTDSSIIFNMSEPVTVPSDGLGFTCNVGGSDIDWPYTVSGSGTTTITLDPTADLPAQTDCRAVLPDSSVSDVDTFDPPDAMARSYVYAFTTA